LNLIQKNFLKNFLKGHRKNFAYFFVVENLDFVNLNNSVNSKKISCGKKNQKDSVLCIFPVEILVFFPLIQHDF